MLQFNQATVYGESLETQGFEAYGSIDGMGLLTFGLVWNCPNIWTGSETSLVTSWANSEPTITTTWSSAEASITTTWSANTGGVFGEC